MTGRDLQRFTRATGHYSEDSPVLDDICDDVGNVGVNLNDPSMISSEQLISWRKQSVSILQRTLCREV